MPSDLREQILRDEFGVPADDIVAAMKDVAVARKQRRHTVGTERVDGLATAAESVRRKLTRLLTGAASPAEEERRLWAHARRRALKEHLKARIEAGAREGVLHRGEGRHVGGQEDAAAPPRRCTFGDVDVREHERIAGDNPCVRRGVPLGLGWGYRQHRSMSLDQFEHHRGPPRDKVNIPLLD